MKLAAVFAPQLPAVPPALPQSGDAWAASDPWIARGRRVLWALIAVFALFGLIGISGAVVATGTVSVEGNYKTVQHLEGGIVSQILVKNGDRVGEGDPILRLDDAQVRASLGIARGRLSDAFIQQARLEAERDAKRSFTLPSRLLLDPADPQVARMLDAQRTLFAARQISRQGEMQVLSQRVEQISNDIGGIERQLIARTREFELNERELKAVLPLFEKGFVNQQRLGPLQRDQARLDGELGRLKSDLARARAAQAEAELKLEQSEREFQSQVADELRKVQAQVTEFTEQRGALEDRLSRTLVRAPRAGRIHALAPTTVGGVIAPGSAIAQVIPEGERMVVEVRIQPQDIDKVRGGYPAAVKFPAFNANKTPRLEGMVTNVSPAQVNDPQQNGKPYFTAQIELSASEIARLGREHPLVPGMPAEVYIETSSRSILSYIIKPLVDTMSQLGRD
jgi:HlyD family secretion protein